MKFLSLFSGIGSPEKALDRLGIDYELVNYCEIDKYASKSYSAIHGVPESKNLGDITKVDADALPKDIDLCFYGFPCQDISLAGKTKGLFNTDGSLTRSGLFFEALRIIEATRPKVAIAENVKNLVSKKFAEQFEIVLNSLESAGYNNYWKVLNSRDYGIPQNRERVFIVSIRKDVDNGEFEFPEGFPLQLRLKDLLEWSVDEKFYLSEENVSKIKTSNFTQEATRIQNDNVCQTLLSRDYKDPKCVEVDVRQIGNVMPTATRDNPNQGRVYDTEGLSPALNCCGGGNRQPFIMINENTKKGYAEAYEGDSVNFNQPNSKTRRGRVGHQICNALTTVCEQGVVENIRLKRGYSVDVLPEAEDTTDIDIIGNYSKSDYNATPIVGKNGIAPTCRENHGQVTAITEPNVLKQQRTEYGKKMRRNGESERFEGTKEYVPRTDGIANTLTSVLKDNLLAEPQDLEKYYLSEKGVAYVVAPKRGMATDINPDVSQPITSEDDTSHLRIRKLTPREYFRLQDFDDADFDKAAAVNSNTQLYKQAGNSITVSVAYHLIKSLFDAHIYERGNEEMEIKVNEYQLPDKIAFNFEELKAELTAKAEKYATLVYTEESIKDAKSDRANLNKLKKALNDERIRREKEYMVPFNEFKAQVNEIIGIIDKPCALIDSQIKGFEEKQKEEKLAKVVSYLADVELSNAEILQGIKIPFDDKWLNASVSMKSIEEEVGNRLEKIVADIGTISNLTEYGFEAMQTYKSTLDLNKAIAEAQRMSQMAKMKAEAEAKKVAEQPTVSKTEKVEPQQTPKAEQPKQWIKFQAYMSMEQAKALGQYMKANGIEYKAV